jgi:hypothetical protein
MLVLMAGCNLVAVSCCWVRFVLFGCCLRGCALLCSRKSIAPLYKAASKKRTGFDYFFLLNTIATAETAKMAAATATAA